MSAVPKSVSDQSSLHCAQHVRDRELLYETHNTHGVYKTDSQQTETEI